MLCKSCNIAKGIGILIEVIQSIPKSILAPMLLKEFADAIVKGAFEKVPFTIGGREFTEVKFK